MKEIVKIIIITLLALAFSWIATCGITKLITWCFNVDFSWEIGTGVWLILLLLGGFRINVKS